jgi:hypothetical protein
MFYLYCRKRTHRDYHFVEIYLVYKNGKLSLPDVRVSRFQGRSVAPEELIGPIPFGPIITLSIEKPVYVGSETCVFTVIPVDSKSLGLVKKEHADVCEHGTWLSYHDTVPKGGPVGPSLSVFYGIPIEPNVFRMLYHGMAKVYQSCSRVWPFKYTEPFVVYHGTSKENIKSIVSEGLKPTQGMLGNAIYFGSFWKAFRFATLTQDYKKRPGAIFRCYTFWSSPFYKTLKSGPCTCGSCGGLFGVDHNGSWKSISEAVFLIPEVGSSVKNEEYACSSVDKVLLDGIAYADAQTEHHEPLNRDLRIH